MVNVLYIEDNQNFAKMVIEWLEDDGYQVVHVGGQSDEDDVDFYQKAIQLLQDPAHDFDIILQDLQLVQFDPETARDVRIHEVVAKLKQERERVGKKLCWIILSASTPEEMDEATREYPVDKCMSKTLIRSSILLDALNSC